MHHLSYWDKVTLKNENKQEKNETIITCFHNLDEVL
jgi:hypothetical protein